jgi:predicted transcriptional regulator
MFDLKRFRKDFKVKQEDLAAVLNVQQSFISQVETGKDQMPDNWIDIIKQNYSIDNISDYITEDKSTEFAGQPCNKCEQKDQTISSLVGMLAEKENENKHLKDLLQKRIEEWKENVKRQWVQEEKQNTG